MQPLISIIVPVYKVEEYLPKCIESIINQTYNHLEILLVDDGSPDCCGAICDEYAKKDIRIKVFHTENRGLSAARNYGITKAIGKYIGFVDSDDWVEPDMFEILINELEKNEADVAICGFYYEYPKRIITAKGINRKFIDNKSLIKVPVIYNISNAIWNKLYKKSCFTDIEFPTGRVFEDIAITFVIFSKITTAICVSKPLYHYRKGRYHSITENHSANYLIDNWLAYKTRYDYYIKDSHFHNDKELNDKLLYSCALVIARIWRWYYILTKSERKRMCYYIKEMQLFSRQYFSCFCKNDWPLYLRFSVFMTRFDNSFAYALLYYMCWIYKRCISNRYYFFRFYYYRKRRIIRFSIVCCISRMERFKSWS